MDDLLRDFLTETSENLDLVDVELVRFEAEPDNAKILGNIFRLVHTVKGACGFLGLPRLEALAHASETLMGRFRSGAVATPDAVSQILAAIDRIKEIMGELERSGAEPAGDDFELVDELERLSERARVETGGPAPAAPPQPAVEAPELVVEAPKPVVEAPQPVAEAPKPAAAKPAPASAVDEEEGPYDPGLSRALRPGEVSLEELDRIFRETPGPALTGPRIIAPPPRAETQPPAAAAVGSASATPGEQGQGVASQTIRVGVDTLDRLMTMVSELVLTRNQLADVVRRSGDEIFGPSLQRLAHVTAELQDGVMKARMQPIGAAWRALPRLVRDLASDLGKKIDLVTDGADAELDRQVLDLIKDPLTHMVRNCADHGLESTADRVAAGKPEVGTITLRAFHQGGYVVVEIADDGRGLDCDRIRRKAVAQGLSTQAEVDRMSDAQALRFIFAPGFSTAEKVTNISGRGVGLDVVRSNIELIGGSVDLRSTYGKGAAFILKIPLTLAIVPALMVRAGEELYAIPQLAVLELVQAGRTGEHRIERIGDARLLRLRNQLLPLVGLKNLLGDGAGSDFGDEALVVVAQSSDEAFGIVVDDVLHTEEVVVKPMATRLKHIQMFSGSAILGDGSVVLILDPNGVAQTVSASPTRDAKHASADFDPDAPVLEASSIVPMLVFQAGPGAPKAAPLALLTRLEVIDVATVEKADGRMLVQYRGTLMPLISAGTNVTIKDSGEQPLLVFTDDGRSVGLIVDEIIDIVEERIEIGLGSASDGALGTAVIAGKATEIIDVAHHLTLAFEDWLSRKDRLVETSERVTILLIDDSAFFRNMLTPALTAAGYRVTPVAGGGAAIDLVRAGRTYDLVVCDIEMPDMDGFSVAKSLIAEPNFAGTPILALSSLTSPEIVRRARLTGFSDFVAKFDRPGLIDALRVLSPIQGRAA